MNHARFPIGESITLEQLESSPYDVLRRLRRTEPVSWVPALGSWLVTGRDQGIDAMRDPSRFTVDDPRFSTAAVLGDSMLSVEGADHERHRAAFAGHFRPNVVRDGFEAWLAAEARRLVAELDPGGAELRTGLAGPLAVNTIARFLGLVDVRPAEILDWYRHIADAILDVSSGRALTAAGRSAVDAIHSSVEATLAAGGHRSLLSTIATEGLLTRDELAPAVAVVMFGAIETSEGMTANALWHLLTHPDTLATVTADRTLVAAAIEESLRLEPAAAVVDRYTTVDVELADVTIPARSPVTISLLAANRDPGVFDEPDRFDITRPNVRQHVTFVQGPHSCIGLHLARLQTAAAVDAMIELCPGVSLEKARTSPPTGLIFRKPAAVSVRWG